MCSHVMKAVPEARSQVRELELAADDVSSVQCPVHP